MPDYSEFPTTPTAWQETQWREARAESVQQLANEDPPRAPRPRVDLVALIPGVAFITIAVVLLSGLDLPVTVFRDGGVLWVVLVVAGLGLLVRELRRGRRR